jgi:hypothetical protein
MITKSIEILKGDKQFFTLKALNSFSPRFFSFTILVKGKEFINLFFRLLDSFNRNVKMPQGSS